MTMAPYDTGEFARLMLGGLSQGNQRREHQDRMQLEQQHFQMQQDALNRQLAQEHAAQTALLGQWDQFNPAPQPYVDEQMSPGFSGPPAQLPNPQFQQYQNTRAALQNAPSHVLGNIVGGFQEVGRQQQIADYHEKIRTKREQDALAKIEAAAKLGHDEADSPMVASMKWVLGQIGYQMPMKTQEHVDKAGVRAAYHELGIQPPTDPNDLQSAAGGDVNALARLNDRGHIGVLPYVMPKMGQGGAGAALPFAEETKRAQDLMTIFPGLNEQRARALVRARSAKEPVGLPSATVNGQPRNPAGNVNQQQITALVQSGDWSILAQFGEEKDKNDLPTYRSGLAKAAMAQAGVDPEEWKLYGSYKSAKAAFDAKNPDGMGKPSSTEFKAVAAAASAMDSYQASRPQAAPQGAPDEAKIRAAIKAMKARGMSPEQIKAALTGGTP